jgi:hypothetical protein
VILSPDLCILPGSSVRRRKARRDLEGVENTEISHRPFQVGEDVFRKSHRRLHAEHPRFGKEDVGLESAQGVDDGRDWNASRNALEENIDIVSMVLQLSRTLDPQHDSDSRSRHTRHRC